MNMSDDTEINFENEVKYLVDKNNLPEDLSKYQSNLIMQGYIRVDEIGEDRVRKKGDKYYRTVKSEGNQLREESEYEISKEEYGKLWLLTVGKRVEKTRYEIPYGNYIIELDIYHKGLEGLYIAEVEFSKDKQEVDFTAPKWFGRNVTTDNAFKNKNLAISGMPKSC